MSLKSTLLRIAIKLTPNIIIIWASNIILKGIAELMAFDFDLDARKIYVKTQLYGESETIEVSLQDFAVFNDGSGYRFIIHNAHSDRAWLNNLLAHFTGRAWSIPAIPQLNGALETVAELFAAESIATKQLDATPDI